VFSDAAITNLRYILELAFKRTTKIAIGKKRIKVWFTAKCLQDSLKNQDQLLVQGREEMVDGCASLSTCCFTRWQ
jgi:hypothetical protein